MRSSKLDDVKWDSDDVQRLFVNANNEESDNNPSGNNSGSEGNNRTGDNENQDDNDGVDAGAIAGGVIAGAVVVGLVALIAWFLRRRRRKNAEVSPPMVQQDQMKNVSEWSTPGSISKAQPVEMPAPQPFELHSETVQPRSELDPESATPRSRHTLSPTSWHR